MTAEVFILAAYGLIVGSFLNALIWRIYTKKKISKGRSMCPDCKHTLYAKDLIPVVSWLWLKGKCRYCKKGISPQYPLVELLTAVLFAGSYLILQPQSGLEWLNFLFWLFILSGLIVLAVYDLRWLILPDVVTLPLAGLAIVQILVNMVATGNTGPGINQLLAGFGVGAVFYALVAVSNGRLMGGGDIKLAFLMGLILGWQNLLVALFIAFNSAAVIGVTLIALKIKARKDYIPFGPFLIAGTIIAFLFGAEIISFYLNFSGLDMLLS